MNEELEALEAQPPGERTSPRWFICECSRPECTDYPVPVRAARLPGRARRRDQAAQGWNTRQAAPITRLGGDPELLETNATRRRPGSLHHRAQLHQSERRRVVAPPICDQVPTPQ